MGREPDGSRGNAQDRAVDGALPPRAAVPSWFVLMLPTREGAPGGAGCGLERLHCSRRASGKR